ncbi:hypothetical protein [uncultured Aquimarina sp.]|uniref:hypothetical protein n=1 Tax=uncultured Aquimarina sp. TaxID=575652 RepID=UPI0026164F21|nr:hypothetical protein [uncultured Aquimarina sp.]
MKYKVYIFLMTILLVFCEVKSQNRIQINIPTADFETEYVWRTIQDINFFEDNNYQISLPKDPLIEDLKIKAKKEKLTNEDYNKLKTFIRDSVYDVTDYQKGYEKIKNQLPLINNLVNEISELDYKWNFKEFSVYNINLTLYGPGGRYDSDEGSILIFTTSKGQFKSYDNPANTIIHEIIHIGIESAIINKFQVPHPLKERIVDTFVLLNFKDDLPNYRIQNMGEYRTDTYIKTKADLKSLYSIVKKIMKSK